MVLNLGNAKFRLFKLELKLVVFETLEYPAEVLQMLLKVRAKIKNFIQTNCHEMIHSIKKCLIYQTLEYSRRIAQT